MALTPSPREWSRSFTKYLKIRTRLRRAFLDKSVASVSAKIESFKKVRLSGALMAEQIEDSVQLSDGIHSRTGSMLDLTASAVTDKVWLEVTSRCNLRCTYCHLSHIEVPEVDIDLTGIDRFIENLKTRKVSELIFNGRGENSFLDGWHHAVRKVLDAGLLVTSVTNLSRAYSDEELEVLSRYASITVSVDTTDPVIFRAIRRKADIRLVLHNILRVQAIAFEQGRKAPDIVWNMIVHSHSMPSLARSVSDGVALGVIHFQFAVLGEMPELEGALNARQLDRLARQEFIEGLEQMRRAGEVAQRRQRRVTMTFGLDSLIANLCQRWSIQERPTFELGG
jgi:molybdenum cofactor biosynthesis enzyme MoaA